MKENCTFLEIFPPVFLIGDPSRRREKTERVRQIKWRLSCSEYAHLRDLRTPNPIGFRVTLSKPTVILGASSSKTIEQPFSGLSRHRTLLSVFLVRR